MSKKKLPLSLHPLTFDAALANLIAVKPKAKKKAARGKSAARRKSKKN